MRQIEGVIRDGVIHLKDPLHGAEGQKVIVSLIEEEVSETDPLADREAEWDGFITMLKSHIIDAGTDDLAAQHDHYLYGKPKDG